MEKDKSWTVPPREEAQRAVGLKQINRQQMLLRLVEVEKLVEQDHPVRAIWERVGRLDLGAFYVEIEAVEGVAGPPVWDPQLLISLWIYAYQDGVSSAREIARWCEYQPAYQWLTGWRWLPIIRWPIFGFVSAGGPNNWPKPEGKQVESPLRLRPGGSDGRNHFDRWF